MFHKPPVRTYERKKAGAHRHAHSAIAITREEIPPDPELQPEEFKSFKDSDESMEYDPFDTTFDRLAKDAKVPPIPPDQISNSSYTDSSSDAIRSKNPSSDEDSLDAAPFMNPEPIPTKITRKRRYNNKKQKLEEQNMAVTTVTVSRDQRGGVRAKYNYKDENTEPNVEHIERDTRGKKKPARKRANRKKDSVVHRETSISVKKTRKRKSLEDPRVVKRCSVSLKRLNTSLDKSETLANQVNADSKKVRVNPDISREFSDIGESRNISFDDDQTGSQDVAVESIIVEEPRIDENRASKRFKNPIVSLSRLSVPRGSSIRDFSSSTPIVPKATKAKSSFRLSPIGNSTNEKTDEHEDNDDLGLASLPPKSMIQAIDSVPVKFTSSLSSRKSNVRAMKESTKRVFKTLSVSPDPEPSGLLFDDTMQKSNTSLTFENHQETTEVSSNNLFMGFGRESSDQDSIHLTYHEEMEESPSENIKDDVKNTKIPSDASPKFTEIHNESMETSTKDPFMGFSRVKTNVSTDNETMGGKSAKYDTDDDWSTISESPDATNDKREIPERRETIEQLSSTENTSSDGISLVSASEMSNSQVEIDEKDTELFVDADENPAIELNDSLKNIVEKPSESDSLIVKRRSLQPVVLLSRLDNLGKTLKVVNTKNMSQSILDTQESIGQLSLNEERSLNAFESSSKIMQSQSLVETDESQIEMDSLKVDEMSENTAEDEKATLMETHEQDSRNNESLVSEEIDAKPSDVSSKSVELLDNRTIEKLPKNLESTKSVKFKSMKIRDNDEDDRLGSIQPIVLLTRLNDPFRITNRRKKYRNWSLELSAISESKGVQAVTAVEKDTEMKKNVETAINRKSKIDDIGEEIPKEREIRLRSKKYSNRNLELSAVSENNDEKATTAIEDDTEMGKVVESVKNRKSKIDNVGEEIPREREIKPRRKKYSNWNLELSAISESNGGKHTAAVEDDTEMEKVNTEEKGNSKMDDIAEEIPKGIDTIMTGEKIRASSQIAFSQQTTDSCGTSFVSNYHNESVRDDKPLFLLPGKSWARSLSILSQVHSQNDLESLAVGKGKKWRKSVQNLLDMQQQRLIQSCVKKNEDDKESRSYSGLRNSGAWIPGSSQSDTSRLFGISSPGRFVRRVSIRVVPDSQNLDDIQDTPFLEAYGITPSENRKTIEARRTLIATRKTLIYNARYESGFENISRTLSTVKPRDVVLAQCGQQSSLPFEECYPESYLKNCRKIGEGVYGEVFLYEKETERNVIKIIPIEGDMKINSERQKKFDEILSEIVIAKELHNLRLPGTSSTSSFVEVKNIRCVMGKYPETLIKLWLNYDEEKNSENDCPAIFEKNQLYIVLELGHGGEDLEAFVFQNAVEARALFIQAALALAVAEDSLEFEHRDLHWGNLLISRTEDSQIDFKLRNKPISVMSKGVKVSIIDFTLSRMSYQGCSIFNDLSMDEDLFVAQGEYQFDIYRLMRQKIENNWQRFEPYTNILWLHYTLDKMITAVRYRRKTTKVHNNAIAKLHELKNEILEYKSAVDFVTNCDKATRLQGSRSSLSTIASAN